jgi:hypothetical protein
MFSHTSQGGTGTQGLFYSLSSIWSWDSIIGTVTRLWAGQPGVRILAGAKDFPPLSDIQTISGAHQPPIQWALGFFPGDKVARA